MKKSVLLLSIGIFMLLLSSSVLAQLPAPPIATENIGAFFSKILTGVPAGTEDVFAKFLLTILLIAVLYIPASKLTGNRKVGLLIAVIVSILGIRFLAPKTVYGVLLPYGTLAIVATIIIPIALLAYVLQQIEFSPIRKIGWIFAAIVFLGLWWTRWTDIGVVAYVYFVGVILSIAFFALDGTIRSWWLGMRAKRGEKTAIDAEVNALRGDVARLAASMATAVSDTERREIREKINRKNRAIGELLKTKPAKE